MDKVVITGANGFIGNALLKYLSEKGVFIYAVVRDKNKLKAMENLNNMIIIESELKDYRYLKDKIMDNDIEVFYNFAWEGHNGEKRSDYKLQLNNVQYTCDAIRAAKELGCKKFIYPGSLIEYEYKKTLENEFYNVGIGNIYGIAKMTARYMGQVISKDLGIEFIPVTISNIYGIGEKADRLFKSTVKKLINNEETKFTECNQMYDFIYIDDAIEAFYLIGEKGIAFKNYYIGNEEPRRLKEFICEIRKCVNKDAILGFGKIPFSGVGLNYTEFNTHSLYEDFKFKPKISFEEGTLKTAQWLLKEEVYK